MKTNLSRISLSRVIWRCFVLLMLGYALAGCAGAPVCTVGNCVDGQGSLVWANGTQYVGEFKDGKKHGQGTHTYVYAVCREIFCATKPGDQYIGEWKDGMQHGQGTFIERNGAKYVGEFKDNKRHGQGTSTSTNGTQYVGEWKDNVRQNGQGTMTYADGSQYAGEWRDGRQNGQGTYTWPDGRKYVGEWRDNRYHGQGTYTAGDGSRKSGRWANDVFLYGGVFPQHFILGTKTFFTEGQWEIISDLKVNNLQIRHVRRLDSEKCSDKSQHDDHLEISGPINPDTSYIVEKLLSKIEESPNYCINPKTGKKITMDIWLNSGGGYMEDGYKLGELFRKYQVNTNIAGTGECYSSCATAFLGGLYRKMHKDSKLMFHAPYTYSTNGRDIACSPSDKKLIPYMQKMLNKSDGEFLYQRTMSHCSSTSGWFLNKDAAQLFEIITIDQQTVSRSIGTETVSRSIGTEIHPGLIGAKFASDATSNIGGVDVTEVRPGSPAAQRGLRSGDIITAVNRRSIKNLRELQSVAQGQSILFLLVSRGDRKLMLQIR
ncbi:PDZ domain-containing protein [Woeseiaceae bacterium]|nr:PDZ domain-containing protein [Woeseiaceae bacterium]